MKKNTTEGFACPGSINDSLTDLLRAGAKRYYTFHRATAIT